MSRSFFFIQDTLSRKFYTDSSNELGDFGKAVLFAQRKNAEKGIRDRFHCWNQSLDYGKVKKTDSSYEYCNALFKLADKRKKLKDWGMVVVEIVIESPK